ncbi:MULTISPECIES: hypothetical protein [Mesorhizobium]|nr:MULTISPECIES: hypothetical protein [Mesorhizobium]
MTPAQRLSALADASPDVAAWITRQLLAGRKPFSEVLAELEARP